MRAREADYASAVAATARLAGRPNYPLAAFLPVSPFHRFPPPPPPLFARRARALYLSPSFPPSPLLSYSAPSPSFRPSRVESSRAAVTVSRWISPHPTPSPLSPRSDRRISRQDFRFSTRHLLLTLFPPPFSRGRRENRVERFLPSFLSSLLHRIENIDTIISERYVYSYIRV